MLVEGQNFALAAEFFAKTGMPHEEHCGCNISSLYVPEACPFLCQPLLNLAIVNSGNGYETWQSSLLNVFVGSFGG